MAVATITYGTATAGTLTLTSLPTSATLVAGQQSASIDNTSVQAIDYAIRLKTKLGATGTANTQIEIWAFGGLASGDFPHDDSDAAIGTSTAAKTLSVSKKAQMKLLHVQPIGADGAAATYDILIGSLAQAFGGVCPPFWGIWVAHNTGGNLSSTGGDHVFTYQSIKYTST
jgi:hypothetical protein